MKVELFECFVDEGTRQRKLKLKPQFRELAALDTDKEPKAVQLCSCPRRNLSSVV